jgi:hypothetical protein
MHRFNKDVVAAAITWTIYLEVYGYFVANAFNFSYLWIQPLVLIGVPLFIATTFGARK